MIQYACKDGIAGMEIWMYGLKKRIHHDHAGFPILQNPGVVFCLIDLSASVLGSRYCGLSGPDGFLD
jgi:hypothetical protein